MDQNTRPPSREIKVEKLTAPSGHPEEKHAITFSALILVFGTLASRILGLIRDMMTARYFSNDVRDAFINAFRLPNLFRRLFGEGSLSVSFVPVFIGILTGKGPGGATEAEMRARGLISSLFTLLLSVSITLSLLAIVFMEDLFRLLLSDEAYLAIPGKFELTVRLGRIMFGFLVLVSIYACFMAILQSLRKFAVIALAPCLFNIAMITAARVSPRLTVPEESLAWAVLVGGFLQMAVLVPSVWRSGYLPRLSVQWNSPEFLSVLKGLVPGLLGMSIMQLTTIVNMYFASRLPSGSQSYLYLADRLLELPLSLFVVSIGSALLPTLARAWAEGNRDAMGDTINHYIRLILFVSLPAALGLLVLAQPIVEVLFLGREFKYADGVATAHIIQIYSISLIFAAGVRILAQGFYAIQNIWFPAVAATVALVSHGLFAFALTRVFGLNGLAAASVLSALVNLVMLILAYNSWIGTLQVRRFLTSFFKFAVCGAAMVGVLQFYGTVLSRFGSRYFPKTLVLMVMIVVGALVYMAMAYVLRVPEFRETLAALREKAMRKIKGAAQS